ncbi:MAG: DUF4838 domain-containing protein [Bacteroidales bacterium]|nr:DUF4838 domain-containing protein [Bacteroidales bacterium]
MKKIAVFLTLFIAFLFASFAQERICFYANQNDYCIVIAKNADSYTKEAATELQHYLEIALSQKYATRSEYSCLKKGRNDTRHAIVIGRNACSEGLYEKYGSQLRPDGFLLHTDGQNLYILGRENDSLSNIYGVYHLLEHCFGFNYLCAGIVHHAVMSQRICCELHDLQNPSFQYRETLHLIPNSDPKYARWHKLHNRADFNNNWGMFVHTFRHLIPVEKYFAPHPEWFSEINGQRVRDGQLCLSNPAVLEELCKNLDARMKAEPQKRFWSVSQNDNYSSCTCPHCQHLDSLYGGPSGTMVWFVNQVAERFPDKTISMLAYQQTRRPPKNIKPADNVNIMFCSIECQRQRPIAENPSDASFQKDMEGWTALSDNILLWDYVVQFRNYMDPFPNLHVLQPNLQNFHSHGIPMMFEQGSGQNITENCEWRTFLLAHLLWDVNINVDSLRNRFLDAYVGPNRAPFIKQYYDEMKQALLESGQVLNIYGYPMDAKNGYLSPENIKYYQSLFKQAFAVEPGQGCFEDDSVYDNRLRLLELPLDFAILDNSLLNLTPDLTFFKYDEKGGVIGLNQEMIDRMRRFEKDCKRLNVNYLDEIRFTPHQFITDIESYLDKTVGGNIARGKKVTCSTEWSNTYDVGGPNALTDGQLGLMNYNYNWLGFWGNHMDVVIDLEESKPINEVRADFFFYPLSWIYVPRHVIVYISDNQEDWTEIGRWSYENEELLAVCKIVPCRIPDLHQQARYVRVRAESLLTNPEWHRGVGQPCWIFCDEVIVR